MLGRFQIVTQQQNHKVDQIEDDEEEEQSNQEKMNVQEDNDPVEGNNQHIQKTSANIQKYDDPSSHYDEQLNDSEFELRPPQSYKLYKQIHTSPKSSYNYQQRMSPQKELNSEKPTFMRNYDRLAEQFKNRQQFLDSILPSQQRPMTQLEKQAMLQEIHPQNDDTKKKRRNIKKPMNQDQIYGTKDRAPSLFKSQLNDQEKILNITTQKDSPLYEAQQVNQIITNPDVIKNIIGIRLRHGRAQYLYEKNSGSKQWKDHALLDQKGYEKEIIYFIAQLDQRVYSALYNYLIHQNDQVHYNRKHIILNGQLKSEEVEYKGEEYSFERFDRRIIKKLKQKLDQLQEKQVEEKVLYYHNLKLNKNLRQIILIESCEMIDKKLICSYVKNGKKYNEDVMIVEKKNPIELALFLRKKIEQQTQQQFN